MDPYDYDDREQAVREMLGETDAYRMSGGPNGPWEYKSLTVRREWNTIRVLDVDGVLAETISVEGLRDGEDAVDDLCKRLEEINSRTMAEL